MNIKLISTSNTEDFNIISTLSIADRKVPIQDEYFKFTSEIHRLPIATKQITQFTPCTTVDLLEI